MDRIADVFPGVPVYVMCVQGGAPQTTPWLFERMPAYQRLLHLIQEHGATAIPAWQILFDHPDEVADGIHPDDAGHARLAATARQLVQTGVYDASRPFCYAVFDGDTTKTSGDLTPGSNFADPDNVARSAVYAWADATMNVHLASTVQVRTGWGNGAVNVCVVPKFARHGGDLNQWPQTIHLDAAGNAGLTLTLTWRLVDTGSDQVLQLAIPQLRRDRRTPGKLHRIHQPHLPRMHLTHRHGPHAWSGNRPLESADVGNVKNRTTACPSACTGTRTVRRQRPRPSTGNDGQAIVPIPSSRRCSRGRRKLFPLRR